LTLGRAALGLRRLLWFEDLFKIGGQGAAEPWPSAGNGFVTRVIWPDPYPAPPAL